MKEEIVGYVDPHGDGEPWAQSDKMFSFYCALHQTIHHWHIPQAEPIEEPGWLENNWVEFGVGLMVMAVLLIAFLIGLPWMFGR